MCCWIEFHKSRAEKQERQWGTLDFWGYQLHGRVLAPSIHLL